MKFTDPIVHIPKKLPPRSSWWTTPKSREEFTQVAKAEEGRIVGNERFGGAKKVHDKGFAKSRTK